MPKEFIIRGRTASLETEVLNMTGWRPGYAYSIHQFDIYPGALIGGANYELSGTISATQIAIPPDAPDFNEDGLIATARGVSAAGTGRSDHFSIVNDLFMITQDLHLMVEDKNNNPINWQVRFKEVRLSASAEAVANYKQYTIYNTSS